MVTSVIDPIKVPSITLSEAEVEEIRDQIDAGNLSPDFLRRYGAALETNVFGEGFQRGKDGKPLEMGRGAAGNQTQQSIDAYIKNQTERRIGGPEPDFEKNLARMRAELAASEPRQRAAAEERRKAERELRQRYGGSRR